MQEYQEEIEVKSKTRLTITQLLTNLLSAHLHTPSIVKPNLRLQTQAVGLAFFVTTSSVATLR